MTVMAKGSPIKRVRARRRSIPYVCTEEATIKRQGELVDRIALITLGNGDPEAGLLFRFGVFMAEHKTVVDDIAEIKGTVKQAILDSGTAKNAFEKYKSSMDGINKEKKEQAGRDAIADDLSKKNIKDEKDLKVTKSRDHWQKVIWIVMAIIAIGSIWVSIWINLKKG